MMNMSYEEVPRLVPTKADVLLAQRGREYFIERIPDIRLHVHQHQSVVARWLDATELQRTLLGRPFHVPEYVALQTWAV